tara:strand:- start:1144 stop:1296 length:153 start_codon:yes stop_codon:yes gene_type:complete
MYNNTYIFIYIIINERWALAKDEIQLMRHLFPDLSRFSALMMYWGNVVDR